MIFDPKRAKILIHNVKANLGWRFQDTVNWQHMVSGMVRGLGSAEGPIALEPHSFRVIADVCSRFSVRYAPHRDSGATPPAPPPALAPTRPGEPRVAIFADALDHFSGMATSLSRWSREADRRGLSLTIHTCGPRVLSDAVMFDQVGTLHMDNFQSFALPMPRVRDVIRYTADAGFDCIHVSTPGPVGMMGLMAARQLGLPLVGTYHTDFPRYSHIYLGSPDAERIAWRFLKWLYGRMNIVFAPSEATRQDLLAHGFDSERIGVVGRGVRCDLFTPELRSDTLRKQWFPDRPRILLYVGRIAREKNMECLSAAFKSLVAERNDTGLVVVGDGPYLKEMQQDLAGMPVIFTGHQTGETLHRIYASCDCFVFPSETDTLGVVILEAQASGLPTLVSDKGGPPYTMEDGKTGFVVRPMSPDTLRDSIVSLFSNAERHAAMRLAAREHAKSHTEEEAFDTFWKHHKEVCLSHEPLASIWKEREQAADAPA